MSESGASTEGPAYRLPPPSAVLKTEVPFPFGGERAWAEGFNHLSFVEGDNICVVKTPEDGKTFFQITVPKNPTLEQIIKATGLFIKEAKISVDLNSLSKVRIFCRDLRNTARVVAEMAKGFDEQKQKKALEFINSLYQLGEGLEKTVNGKEDKDNSVTTFTSLDDERLNQYELPPQKTDLKGYKNNLLLSLLGKNYQSFAEANRQDPKLSQVVQHSTYYSWFNRFIERKKAKGEEIPQDYKKKIEEFDRWLISNKKTLFSHLFPFVPESLQKGGRGYTAFWEVVTRNIFYLLDQAIEEEGWQKAKEPLKPPLLFTDLGKEIQERLRQLNLLSDVVLDFEKYKLQTGSIPKAIEHIKQEARKQRYGKMPLFDVAKEILKKDRQPPTRKKIEALWELVQAYEFKKTYLLTSAVEEQAFECNLRSYILGRLLQELMGSEVEVYTVKPRGHVLLLVVDKSTNEGYWVDPTGQRFYYDENKNERLSNFEKPVVYKIESDEWQSIQQQINASPDNFHISGRFTIYNQPEFATILPFRQGIEASFWNNFRFILYKKFIDERSYKERIKLIKEIYYCLKKVLELDPNCPDYHNNLALIYIAKGLAEAMVREKYGEKLTKAQEGEVDRLYYENFNDAFQHMRRAFNLDPIPDRLDRFFLVVKQIPDGQAQQVLDALTPQTKELILEMYKIYQDKKPKLDFGANFENTQFWQLMKQ